MGAYRGAGRPEANYYMERLIDRAADEMGINRLTLRKRNFIKPAQMPFPASSGVTYDSVELRKIIFEPDGTVKLTTGTLDYGQGHATPFAQVLSAQLGVPFEKVKLEQDDSDLVRFGNGTGGSRSITATGHGDRREALRPGDRQGQAGSRASHGGIRRRH